MRIKRLILSIFLLLLSAGILAGVVFGVPAASSALREADTSWLLIPLLIVVAIVVIAGLYKILGAFASEDS